LGVERLHVSRDTWNSEILRHGRNLGLLHFQTPLSLRCNTTSSYLRYLPGFRGWRLIRCSCRMILCTILRVSGDPVSGWHCDRSFQPAPGFGDAIFLRRWVPHSSSTAPCLWHGCDWRGCEETEGFRLWDLLLLVLSGRKTRCALVEWRCRAC
jgi:hypothetical protein